MIVGGVPMLFGSALQATISLTDNALSGSNSTTYTFSARALGAAATSRRVAVGLFVSSAGLNISSVTIGGVAASQVVIATKNTGAEILITAIYMATVPTGTTGDIVVVAGTSSYMCGIDVYRLENISTTAYHTATDTTITSDAESASLNLIADGAAIGVFSHNSAGLPRSTTWTNLTEQTDRTVEGSFSMSSAANVTTTTQTLTITATAFLGITNAVLVLASFQPG